MVMWQFESLIKRDKEGIGGTRGDMRVERQQKSKEEEERKSRENHWAPSLQFTLVAVAPLFLAG